MRNLPHGYEIYLVNIKTMRKFAQIFVAISEKLNFNRLPVYSARRIFCTSKNLPELILNLISILEKRGFLCVFFFIHSKENQEALCNHKRLSSFLKGFCSKLHAALSLNGQYCPFSRFTTSG